MILTRETVERWPMALQQTGARVVAPVTMNGHVEYRELTAATKATGFGNGLPQQSPKAAWFPRSEPILKFQRNGRDWSVEDPEISFQPVVIFGARPCDAAAREILAPLFGWDFHDPLFEQRLKTVAIGGHASIVPSRAASHFRTLFSCKMSLNWGPDSHAR